MNLVARKFRWRAEANSNCLIVFLKMQPTTFRIMPNLLIILGPVIVLYTLIKLSKRPPRFPPGKIDYVCTKSPNIFGHPRRLKPVFIFLNQALEDYRCWDTFHLSSPKRNHFSKPCKNWLRSTDRWLAFIWDPISRWFRLSGQRLSEKPCKTRISTADFAVPYNFILWHLGRD